MKKYFPVLLASLFFTLRAYPQDKIKPSFVAICVSNIDSAVSWYCNILNLKLRNRYDNEERGVKQVVLINKEIMIELIELKRAVILDTLLSSQPKGTLATGVLKFGFTVKDLDKTHQEMSAKKVSFFGRTVKDPVNNKRTFLIKDPDGNLLQFFEE